ncbi:WhiB family transcriptional regulator [Streptomyces sp. GB4-14]|uniref:WhiB family transcriptional regulator n=1 Tax=Streptomyces sp. GB4-14 TaxID=2498703 RepID=UPI001F5E7DEB|nr:WhiB family transcriptional regulator [Streptomyces sp. GB4-14]
MTSLHDLMIRTPGLPCRLDPDTWFSDNSRERDAAVRLCRTCPLQQACAEQAIAEREPHGVWGGTTTADRRAFWTGEPHRFDEQGRLRLLCGSERAYRAHFTYREKPGPDCVDGDCVAAHEALVTEQRREQLARHHAAGGSAAGYYLHRRLGERACEACMDARRVPAARRGSRRPRSASRTSGPTAVLPGPQTGVQPLAVAA